MTAAAPSPADLASSFRRRPAATALSIELPVRGEHHVELPVRGRDVCPRERMRVTKTKWRVHVSDIDGLPVWTVTLYGHRLDFWGDPGPTDTRSYRPPAHLGLTQSPAAVAFGDPLPHFVEIPTQWIDLARALVDGGVS